jgi:hypothetical protein
MKLLLTLLLFSVLSQLSFAADVKLAWDDDPVKNPAASTRYVLQSAPKPILGAQPVWTNLKTDIQSMGATTTTTVTLPEGPVLLQVYAIDVPSGVKSNPSDPLELRVPAGPKSLRVMVSFQSSTNMKDWTDQYVSLESDEKKYFRTVIETLE